MLKENVKKYLELKKLADKVKNEMDELKPLIINDIDALKQTTFTTEEGITAKLITKVTVKYNDEPAMIEWLEKKNMNSYITKSINSTLLNKELKTSTMLNEGLGSMITKKSSITLSVEDK